MCWLSNMAVLAAWMTTLVLDLLSYMGTLRWQTRRAELAAVLTRRCKILPQVGDLPICPCRRILFILRRAPKSILSTNAGLRLSSVPRTALAVIWRPGDLQGNSP